jgi:hypothetical protein
MTRSVSAIKSSVDGFGITSSRSKLYLLFLTQLVVFKILILHQIFNPINVLKLDRNI